jgi:hypothetical protein
VQYEAPEFPSDNPDLWMARPHGSSGLRPVTPGRSSGLVVEGEEASSASEPAESADEVLVVEWSDADFTGIEIESIPPPAPPDPFQTFVRTLVEVALAAGASARVVEILPAMLGAARLDLRALDLAAIDALVAANLLARGEAGIVTRSESLLTAAQAWGATLRGEDADLSTCTTTLDEWSANLIAELAGVPSQREAVRRDLRARGVAAFGMAA